MVQEQRGRKKEDSVRHSHATHTYLACLGAHFHALWGLHKKASIPFSSIVTAKVYSQMKMCIHKKKKKKKLSGHVSTIRLVPCTVRVNIARKHKSLLQVVNCYEKKSWRSKKKKKEKKNLACRNGAAKKGTHSFMPHTHKYI